MIGVAGLVALAVGLLMFPLGSSCGETCPTWEQLAYFEKQAEAGVRFGTANYELLAVVRELDTSQALFYDEGWRRRLRRSLDEVNAISAERRNFKPPPGAERLHSEWIRTAGMYIEANEMGWEGILADDADMINQSNARRAEANRLSEELAEAFAAFCE